MPDIKFYHNAPERLGTACAIAAKAMRQGRRIVLLSPDSAALKQVDEMLWAAQPLGFIPHVASDSPLAERTPMLLASSLNELAHEDVLVNLGDEPPEGFERFQTIVEIVARDEADRGLARRRWMFYKERGFEVTAHDLSASKN